MAFLLSATVDAVATAWPEEPMEQTTPGARAIAVLEMARTGRFAEIHDLFAPRLREMVPPESLRVAWDAEVARCGPVTSAGAPVTEPGAPGVVVVKIPVTFERGDLTVAVSLAGDQGWVMGIQILPASAAQPHQAWEPPGYADPACFGEEDVTVGSGPLAVRGTLSLPRQAGPWSAAVLLSGSGPHDRDETIGRNKPLKDLAWGLASRGVAVLRFDKVTYAHPGEVVKDHGFTVTDEYVPHAVAAVRLLQRHPSVDADRVFVAGHSLGGTAAPRVAAAERSVAGLVVMAGGTEPLHWSAVRQFRYLASLRPENAAASQHTIDAITRQARMVDSPGLSPVTAASELPFGAPAAYWLDLRGYDPASSAAALAKPMLIVQGGRDYQVTVDGDLAGWKARLDGRSDVTIRVYDADNHLFFTGTGPSAPAEYEPAQHMDAAVVADIASWLTAPLADARGSATASRS
jgi:dienelactone hydrolase